MRIASLTTVALFLAVAPASASDYPETRIGDWILTGNNNVCTAGLRADGALLVLVSADGDNDGGIAVITQDPTGSDGTPRDLDFQIAGRHERVAGQYTADPNGYWIPYGMSTAMPRLPDDAVFVVSDDGKQVIRAALGPIRKVVATLRECDAELARKSGT